MYLCDCIPLPAACLFPLVSVCDMRPPGPSVDNPREQGGGRQPGSGGHHLRHRWAQHRGDDAHGGAKQDQVCLQQAGTHHAEVKAKQRTEIIHAPTNPNSVLVVCYRPFCFAFVFSSKTKRSNIKQRNVSTGRFVVSSSDQNVPQHFPQLQEWTPPCLSSPTRRYKHKDNRQINTEIPTLNTCILVCFVCMSVMRAL